MELIVCITKIILNPSSNPPPTDATTLAIGAVRRKLLKQDFSKRTSISVIIDQWPGSCETTGRWCGSVGESKLSQVVDNLVLSLLLMILLWLMLLLLLFLLMTIMIMTMLLLVTMIMMTAYWHIPTIQWQCWCWCWYWGWCKCWCRACYLSMLISILI